MPRARNEHTERAILSAAWQLFFKKGLAHTSYTDLAERSGVSRPLVQRYFPRKELLVDRCVREIRTAAVRACDEAFPASVDPLVRLYLRGQVNIATYFACNGIRRLMLDVLASRDLTQQTIADGFQWTVVETLPERPEVAHNPEPDELIMAMGGLFELVYVYLDRGETPNIAACTLPSVQVFGRLFEVDVPEAELKAHAIETAELEQLARRAVELVKW